MKYHAPLYPEGIDNPRPEQMEQILRTMPHAYWQQGGNGEALIDTDGGPNLCIKQPLPERFFFMYAVPSQEMLWTYNGESCESLIEDEAGGNPFWIPEACLVSVDQAVEIVSHFLMHQAPSPRVGWSDCDGLSFPENYPED